MHELGFFISIGLVGILAWTLGSFLDGAKRLRRRGYIESRPPQPDGDFCAGVSALFPVTPDFCRTFRRTVGRALGIDHDRLDPQDRIIADLRAYGFDAMELAASLEQAFDTRVRVVDVVRAQTLRKLAMLIHERMNELSEFEPPLHRDAVPKGKAPEQEPPTGQVPGADLSAMPPV